MAAKMGRPTDNPKGSSINLRLDATSAKILKEYTEQESITRAEAIRAGIKKLETDLKK